VIITAAGLSKNFGPTQALRAVTCEVGEGATGLLGPNGAGKTTFLRVLLGLLSAEGEARVLGVDPMRRPLEVRARVGYMPESECIIPGLHALDVVAYLGRLSGMPRRDAFKRAHEVLYYVGLGEERYRDATGFSMGMQQRLKLATALVHDPNLLLLDEPTNGLDPAGRTEMLELVAELARDHGKNVLLSSHLLRDVEQVCSQVIVFHEGRLVRVEDLDALAAAAPSACFEVEVRGDEEAFVAALAELGGRRDEGEGFRVLLPDGADASLLFRAARSSGTQLRGLQATVKSLEDVFFESVSADGS
jgi:ABC-2 type transport system ATP-binding protein